MLPRSGAIPSLFNLSTSPKSLKDVVFVTESISKVESPNNSSLVSLLNSIPVTLTFAPAGAITIKGSPSAPRAL